MKTIHPSVAAAMGLTLLTLLLPGCASVPAVAQAEPVTSSGLAPDQIHWPAPYRPEEAAFFVHNEIQIAAPPQVVWDILIEAEGWPSWYEGASEVQVRGSTRGVLAPGAALAWKTMGLRFVSEIKEFAPPHRLSWESRKATLQGYHAWLIVPTPDGCRVITDEAQQGLLARLQGIFIPDKLHRLHDVWLRELKRRAEQRVVDARVQGLP